jgi:hypothetical protein
MLYIKVTLEEARRIGFHKVGIKSAKKDPITGERENIYFVKNIDFLKSGIEREKEIIEI